MKNPTTNKSLLSGTRRKFLQYGTAIGVGAQSFLNSGNVKAAVVEGKEAAGLVRNGLKCNTASSEEPDITRAA